MPEIATVIGVTPVSATVVSVPVVSAIAQAMAA
jgi:hypothetical protein